MMLPPPPSYSVLYPPTTALAAFFPPSSSAVIDSDLLPVAAQPCKRPAGFDHSRTIGRDAFGLEGFCSFSGVAASDKAADWDWLDFARHHSDSDDHNSGGSTDDDDELASPTPVVALRHPALVVRLPQRAALDGSGKPKAPNSPGSPMLETSFGFTDDLLEGDAQPATPGALSLKSVLSYFSLPELPNVLPQNKAPDPTFINANQFRSVSTSSFEDSSSQTSPWSALHEDDTGAEGDDESSELSDRLARRSSISKSNSSGMKSTTRVSFSFQA